jgi:hypothetical protein
MACAWLPDEKVSTPPRFDSSGSCASALYAPRNLKAPVRWKHSHLKKAVVDHLLSTVLEVTTAVSVATPCSLRAAASMSEKSTSVGGDVRSTFMRFYAEKALSAVKDV